MQEVQLPYQNLRSEVEIREQIVRARSWDELFLTREAELFDFLFIVDDAHDQHLDNGTLAYYNIQNLADGDAHVLGYTSGGYSLYQKRFSDRNVFTEFEDPEFNGNHQHLITCDVGTIAHSYTLSDLITPPSENISRFMESRSRRNAIQEQLGVSLDSLRRLAQGKPAYSEWENTMIYNSALPIRIGHRIFPDYLFVALSFLRKNYPKLFWETD